MLNYKNWKVCLGLDHLKEQMFFKGGKRRSKGGVSNRTSEGGLDLPQYHRNKHHLKTKMGQVEPLWNDLLTTWLCKACHQLQKRSWVKRCDVAWMMDPLSPRPDVSQVHATKSHPVMTTHHNNSTTGRKSKISQWLKYSLVAHSCSFTSQIAFVQFSSICLAGLDIAVFTFLRWKRTVISLYSNLAISPTESQCSKLLVDLYPWPELSRFMSGGCSHSSSTWAELGWAPGKPWLFHWFHRFSCSNRFGKRWELRMIAIANWRQYVPRGWTGAKWSGRQVVTVLPRGLWGCATRTLCFSWTWRQWRRCQVGWKFEAQICWTKKSALGDIWHDFLCRTYCWVFREDAAGSLQLRKTRFKLGLFLFVLLVLRQRDWTALSQGRGAAISMLPSSYRCRVRLALGPNCEANPKIHSWALTWPHCRQAMETFKGLPIFWADKPLPGLIVVNSPRQVTHQLPRFDLDSKAKFRLGRTLFDPNHLGCLTVKLGVFTLRYGSNLHPKLWSMVKCQNDLFIRWSCSKS